jgi:hypothetical protein
MFRNSPRTRWALTTIIGMAFIGFGLLTGCTTEPTAESGAASPRDAADAYVRGLNDRDVGALRRLAPPGNDAAGEIQGRLDAYGGRSIRIESVDVNQDLSPDHATVRLRGSAAGGPYEETLTMTRDKRDRWHVALGQAAPDPRRTPAGTAPPD